MPSPGFDPVPVRAPLRAEPPLGERLRTFSNDQRQTPTVRPKAGFRNHSILGSLVWRRWRQEIGGLRTADRDALGRGQRLNLRERRVGLFKLPTDAHQFLFELIAAPPQLFDGTQQGTHLHGDPFVGQAGSFWSESDAHAATGAAN